jgi:sugar lactone lactonase YvrE
MRVRLPWISAVRRSFLLSFLILTACFVALAPNLQAQTPAATAHFAYAQTAVFSSLYWPEGLAVDNSGNLYIADEVNQRVVKETWSAGAYTQSVVATGFDSPQDVAVDSYGNVYVADTALSQILEVLWTGSGYSAPTALTFTSVVLNPQGIAVDGNNNLYIANTYGHCVMIEQPNGSGGYTESIPFTSANGLVYPSGVAVDRSGNLYIADENVSQVFKETLSGGSYTQSMIGTSLTAPVKVAVDESGDVYVIDSATSLVFKETPSGSGYTETQIAGGNADSLSFPLGVAVDAKVYVYISNSGRSQVYKRAIAGVDFWSVAVGESSATISLTFWFDSAGYINTPAVLTMGAPYQDFTDAGTGTCTTYGPVEYDPTGMYGPSSCTVDVRFSPKQAGARNGAVVLSDSAGVPIATAYIYGTGTGPQVTYSPATQSGVTDSTKNGSNFAPISVAVDGSGNVYIVDSGNNQVLKEMLSGGSYAQTTVANSTNNGLSYPQFVALDGSGNVYIADDNNSRVLKETPHPDGSYTQSVVVSTLYLEPYGVAVDGSGNVYVTDMQYKQVLKETLQADGTYTQSVVTDSTKNGISFAPIGVAVDGSGNVYIADVNNSRVLKETLQPDGSYSQSQVGNGLSYNNDVVVDGIGNVYIVDTDNNRVLKETLQPDGSYIQSVIADDSLAYGLHYPMGAAVDGSGNVYIADFFNARVVKEDLADPPAMSFGTITDGNTSSPISVEIVNNGNQTLSAITPGLVVAGSTNTSDFIQVSGSGTPGDCSTTFSLLPGSVCNLSIEFTPALSDSGSIGGTATLTDNNLNASPSTTQTIMLSGTAQSAGVAPSFTSGVSTTFTVGQSGSFPVTATGTPTPTFTELGTLPAGVTLSTSGILSGTPGTGTAGSYPITITASNGVSPDATQYFTLTVDQAPAITSGTGTTFTVGTAGSFTVTTSGSPTASLSESGALPSGVSFVDNGNGTATLAGTPAAGTGGAYSITITAKNGVGSNATQSFTLTVDQAPAITSANSATFTVGVAGSFTVTTTGYPTPGLSESGALPSGVSFTDNGNRTATLAGTPAAGTGATYSITITAKNGVGSNATQPFTLTVQNATGTITLSPASMPAGTVGSSYRQTVTASGGKAPYRYTISSGTLPSGLSLTTAGVLSGLPVANGTFGFTIKATDAKGATGSQAYTLVINPPVILLSPNTLPAGTVGRSYRQTMTASGGIAPYTYTVSGGTLPSGLSLMKSGVLYGTPSASGTFNFTIKATDSKGYTGSWAYTLVISPPTITLSPTSLPAGTVGKSYRQTLTASGGIAPYNYAVTSGALPSGLSLTKAGVLAGTPTVSGSFTFTITATDSSTGGPYSGSHSYSLVVNKARP